MVVSRENNEKAFETFVNLIQEEKSKDKSSEIRKTESRINTLIKIASKLYEDYANDLMYNVIGFKVVFLHAVPSAEKFYSVNGFNPIEV